MVAASAPTVVTNTASWAVTAPVGVTPLSTPCAATASAAVSSPAAVPRRRAPGSLVVIRSEHAQPGHQVGVDRVELSGDRRVRGAAP